MVGTFNSMKKRSKTVMYLPLSVHAFKKPFTNMIMIVLMEYYFINVSLLKINWFNNMNRY